MKRKYFSHSVILLALTVVTFGVDGRAQEPQEKRIAKLTAAESGVKWTVSLPHAGTTLVVVAPDGRIFREEFGVGESPEFGLAEPNRERLPDGVYIYELRIHPVASVAMKEKLRAERGSDDESEEIRNARKRAPVEFLTESGSFAVVYGQPIVAGGMEPQRGFTPRARVAPAEPMTSRHAAVLRNHVRMKPPDELISDDLIVQGNVCVGLDCATGEVFGYDTIRLKEENLRLKFDDTSTSTGFPANDWQITANDSSSGGSSKFSIEDLTAAKVPFTIRAAAPTDSLFVASDGKIGFRTAVPQKDLHMSTSDTPAVRFEQNNSGGYTPQTWDIAGNEANFFVRDVTGGSKLPFRIRPGAPTSSIDISATGNVGVATSSPSAQFHVVGADTNEFAGTFEQSDTTASNGVSIKTRTSNSGDAALHVASNNGATVVISARNNGFVGIGTSSPTDNLSVNGTASKTGGGSWAVFSDERLKEIKGRFSNGLNAVMRLQPLRYNYKPDNQLGLKSAEEHVGFRAQELQKVIPEAVTTNANGFLQVNNDPILWTMLNAIKEQQKQIRELKMEVRKLRGNPRRHRR